MASLAADSLKDFKQALNKIRAVVDSAEKDYLSSLDADIEVHPTGSHFPLDDMSRNDQADNAPGGTHSAERWLRECRSALVRRRPSSLPGTAD